MTISVACKCGKKFVVKDEMAGKRGKCAACGAALTIPVPQAAAGDLEPLGDLDLNALGSPVGALSGDPLAGDLLGGDPLAAAATMTAAPATSPLMGGTYGAGFGAKGPVAPGKGKPAAKPGAKPAAGGETPIYLRWYVLAGVGALAAVLVVGVGIGAFLAFSGGSSAVASAPVKPAVPTPPTVPSAPSTPSTPAIPAAPVVAMKVQSPPEVVIEPGTIIYIDILIERAGTVGPLHVIADSLPDKVTTVQVEVPADQSAARFTMTAAADAAEGVKPGKIVVSAGTARVEQPLGVTVKKLVPPSLLPLAAVSLSPGGNATIEIKIERNGAIGPIQVTLDGLPPRVTALPLEIAADQTSGQLQLAAAADLGDTQKSVRVLAAVGGRSAETPLQLSVEKFPFKVLPMPVVWLAPSEKTMVEVKVERRSFQGPIEISAQGLPEQVSVAPATIPAGQSSVKVEVSAAADAKDKVRSGKLVATAGSSTADKFFIVRVKKGEGSLLPDVIVDPELAGLLKRGSFGGRLTAESKQALMDIFGGTKESEAAVLAGLRWLDKHQAADGHWAVDSYNQFAPNCDCEIPMEDKVAANNTAGTALGVLPFLGAGITPKNSPESPKELKKYQKTVKSAIAYLIKNQNDAKDANGGDLGGGMYAHALGTIALCEAYALTKDNEIQVPAQKAVRYLLAAQHPASGGWGYGPKQEGDTSVVGWVFLAIRSGQMSGMPIDPHILSQAGKFLDNTSAGEESYKKSRYSYKPKMDPTNALSAAGLLSRQYLGWQQDRIELSEGSKHLMQDLPPESGDKVGRSYYFYYATQVLHHLEGKNWDLWNHYMREHLIRTQEKSGHKLGSWSPEGADWGAQGGRMYTTALSILTLEAYYRHLPLYRKIPKVSAE